MQDTTSDRQTSDYLYALILKLRPRGAGDILPNAGQLAHAALLHWLAEVDPALAARLHEPNNDRPFTCSSLWFPNEREVALAQRANRRLPILPAQNYWLRLCLLTDELFRALTSRFLRPVAPAIGNGKPGGLDLPSLRLGGVHFDVAELIAMAPDSDAPPSGPLSWAGYGTYSGLVARARALDPAALATRTIGLEFRSPTAFSDGQRAWGKSTHLFPDPERVFDRLARVWNAWAPSALALKVPAVRDYARDWVVVSQHSLATHTFHFDRHMQVGFAGCCTYRLMDLDLPASYRPRTSSRNAGEGSEGMSMVARPRRGEEPPPAATAGADLTPAQALHLLAAFAFFAGVGQKTTMGMGQARPFPTSAPARPAADPAERIVRFSRDSVVPGAVSAPISST